MCVTTSVCQLSQELDFIKSWFVSLSNMVWFFDKTAYMAILVGYASFYFHAIFIEFNTKYSRHKITRALWIKCENTNLNFTHNYSMHVGLSNSKLCILYIFFHELPNSRIVLYHWIEVVFRCETPFMGKPSFCTLNQVPIVSIDVLCIYPDVYIYMYVLEHVCSSIRIAKCWFIVYDAFLFASIQFDFIWFFNNTGVGVALGVFKKQSGDTQTNTYIYYMQT